MTTKILIKRTTGTGDPSAIDAGELAYKYGNDRLLIGNSGGTSALVIGGKVFADKLDHTNGVLNASSAMVTDSDSKIDNIKVKGVAGGSGNVGTISFDNVASTHATTLRGQNVSSNVNIDLPTSAGTLVGTGDTGSITNGMIDTGTIANDKLANSSLQVGSTSISLGGQATTIAGVEELTVDNINLKDNTISTTTGNLTINPNGSSTIDVSGTRITSLGTPSGAEDAATKGYVDGVVNGLDIKESVKLATTANIAGTYSSGAGTITKSGNGAIGDIDGVTGTQGIRILVKNQTNEFENGIYVLTAVGDGSNPYVLTRAGDANASAEISGGSFFFVEQGNTNADNGFVTTHNGNPNLTSDSIIFQQFSGAGQITTGDGIQKSGNEISVDLKANSGLEIDGGEIRLNLGASTINGTLAIADGGTGETSFVANRILIGNGTSALNQVAIGNSGEFLISGGSGSAPSFTNTIDGGTYP